MTKSERLPSNKSVGLLFSIVFLCLAIYSFVYYGMNNYFYSFIAVSIFLFIITFVYPPFLTPLNKFWMGIAYYGSKIISPVVLALIFFLIITPVAVITRVFGRDELKLSKKNKKSYWINRIPNGPEAKSFKNQY